MCMLMLLPCACAYQSDFSWYIFCNLLFNSWRSNSLNILKMKKKCTNWKIFSLFLYSFFKQLNVDNKFLATIIFSLFIGFMVKLVLEFFFAVCFHIFSCIWLKGIKSKFKRTIKVNGKGSSWKHLFLQVIEVYRKNYTFYTYDVAIEANYFQPYFSHSFLLPLWLVINLQ